MGAPSARYDAALRMDRAALVAKLVGGEHLSREEREALGAYVRRAEVAAAIAALLASEGRFPRDAHVHGGWQIVVAGGVVRLESHRTSQRTTRAFRDAGSAIDHYIDHEVGPSIGGVVLRST